MQAIDSIMAAKTERRRKQRKRPASLVYVELAAANGGMMRDLSEEGFALRAMMPLRIGEKTPFRFSLDESTNIAGEGDIRWVEDDGKVAGVRFTEISPASLGQIREWLIKGGQLPKGKTKPARALDPSPTLDELRQELRSSPARPTVPAAKETISPSAPMATSVPATPASATPPADTEDVSALRDVPSPPVSSQSSAVVPAVPTPAVRTESVPATPAIPLPPMNLHWRAAVPEVSAPAAQMENVPAAPATPAPQVKKEKVPALPDISTILLQPGMVRKISEPLELQRDVPALEPSPLMAEERHRKRGNWMERFTLTTAVGIMLILVLLASVYVYQREVGLAVIRVGQKIAGTDQQGDGNTSAVDNPASTSVPAHQTQAKPGTIRQSGTTRPNPPSKPMNQEPKNASPAASSENMPQLSSTQANKSALPPVAPLTDSTRAATGAPTEQEMGQTEFQQALQLLRGKNREADMPEAVRLLWDSVEKGNPGAELALAELFWHGQGVTKSCDQARILLSAAARKGDAEARTRLKQFEEEGCE